MRLTVFASASPQAPAPFVHATTAFGRDLAEAGVTLVYGGGNVGLMGALADGALSAGGEVIGVMPRSPADAEIAHPGLTELRIVTTFHERKAELATLGDAFAALPGGAGTLEELFEAWTWQLLGLHTKPVALLNLHDYWTPLLTALDTMTTTGFIRPTDRSSLIVAPDAKTLLTATAAFTPPQHKYAR
jgi:uncharacterized protein (TIGR00730 family)